jgi:hypothetical protein
MESASSEKSLLKPDGYVDPFDWQLEVMLRMFTILLLSHRTAANIGNRIGNIVPGSRLYGLRGTGSACMASIMYWVHH